MQFKVDGVISNIVLHLSNIKLFVTIILNWKQATSWVKPTDLLDITLINYGMCVCRCSQGFLRFFSSVIHVKEGNDSLTYLLNVTIINNKHVKILIMMVHVCGSLKSSVSYYISKKYLDWYLVHNA